VPPVAFAIRSAEADSFDSITYDAKRKSKGRIAMAYLSKDEFRDTKVLFVISLCY